MDFDGQPTRYGMCSFTLRPCVMGCRRLRVRVAAGSDREKIEKVLRLADPASGATTGEAAAAKQAAERLAAKHSTVIERGYCAVAQRWNGDAGLQHGMRGAALGGQIA